MHQRANHIATRVLTARVRAKDSFVLAKMDTVFKEVSERLVVFLTFSAIFAFSLWYLQAAFFAIFLSSLSKYPGPKLAAVSAYYKTWIECILGISWHEHLGQLHTQYGHVVRVGPNELHFSEPQAYLDIYNNSNRWDKEPNLYHSFGEDRSSFGYLTYKEAKERKDVLNRSFSARAIVDAQGLVQGKIDELCSVFTSLARSNKLANISHAYRCMTMDIITYYCFGTSIDAIHAPKFRAPIIVAMDASLPVFVWFKHSSLYKNMIMKCPRPLSRIISPPTAGLVDLQEILETQINNLTARPEALDLLPHRMTIYHSLLDKSNYVKSGQSPPSAGSLYEEAQALMFAGADTVGNTLMMATFHLLKPENTQHLENLQAELRRVSPNPSQPPPTSQLEALPYLNATIKESLRLSSGVISGLPRLVGPHGATIATHPVPAGTIVSISSTFVHYNATLFASPTTFNPDRWLSDTNLDRWLVAFSRGPRSCLGVNLAWTELRLALATLFRRFDLELAPDAPARLRFRDAFLPEFVGGPVNVRVRLAA